MKPLKLISFIILSLFFSIIFMRSCQDDYDMEDDRVNMNGGEDLSLQRENLQLSNAVDTAESKNVHNHSLWPDSIYSTIVNADYLSNVEKEVIIELNKCRTNPVRYSNEVLVPFLHAMSNSGFFVDSKGRNIRTIEGRVAVEEAIDALNNQKAGTMLYPKKYLYLAAKDHCDNQGPENLLGHVGIDGSTPISRVKRHNPKVHSIGENIAYGMFSAREIMISLLVDDNVPDRGHRNNIFRNYSNIGVAIGDHKGYTIMCVQDFE